jgi:hypothetical protein
VILSYFSAACPLFVLTLLSPYNDLSVGQGSSAEGHLWGCFLEWRNKGEGQKGNRPLKNQTITNRQTMKTKSRFLPPKTRKVGHHPYIYLPVSMTK